MLNNHAAVVSTLKKVLSKLKVRSKLRMSQNLKKGNGYWLPINSFN